MPTHKKGGHGRGSEAPAARTMGERTYRCHPVDRTHLRRGPPTPWRPLGVSLAKAQLRHKSQNSDRPNRARKVSLWQTVRNYAEFPAQPTRVDRGHGGDSRTRGGAPGVRNVSQHRPFPISAPVTRPLASPASPALGCPIYHSQTKASLTSPHDRRLPPRADLNPLPTAGYPRATGRWMDSSGKRWYEPLARSPRSVAQSHSFIRRTLGSVSPSSRPLARPHALTFPIVHKPTSNHHRSRSHGRDA